MCREHGVTPLDVAKPAFLPDVRAHGFKQVHFSRYRDLKCTLYQVLGEEKFIAQLQAYNRHMSSVCELCMAKVVCPIVDFINSDKQPAFEDLHHPAGLSGAFLQMTEHHDVYEFYAAGFWAARIRLGRYHEAARLWLPDVLENNRTHVFAQGVQSATPSHLVALCLLNDLYFLNTSHIEAIYKQYVKRFGDIFPPTWSCTECKPSTYKSLLPHCEHCYVPAV